MNAALPRLLTTSVLALCSCAPDPVELSVWDIITDNTGFAGIALTCAGTGALEAPQYGELNLRLTLVTSPQVCISVQSGPLGAGLGLDTADQEVCILETDPCPGEESLGDTCIHQARATFSGEDLGPFDQISMVINASESVPWWGSTWTGRSSQPSDSPLGPLVVGTYTLEDGGCTAFALTPY